MNGKTVFGALALAFMLIACSGKPPASRAPPPPPPPAPAGAVQPADSAAKPAPAEPQK